MPPKIKDEEAPVEDTATPAVVEILDPKNTVTFEFQGGVYSFKSKRLEAVQFRKRMQQRRDGDAIEWLLGETQFEKLMDSTADEDGCTTIETWKEFFDALGDATGTGNS